MPSIKEKKSDGNNPELEGDQRGDQPPSVQAKKKLVIFESRNSKEKLLTVDLQKIRANLRSKMSQAQDQLTQSNIDEIINEIRKTDQKTARENADKTTHLEKVEVVKTDKKPTAQIEEDTEEYLKMITALAETTFRQCLSNLGYMVNSTNAFVAEGGYGIVYRVHKAGQRYACKVISNMLFKSDRGPLNTEKLRTRFANEVDIMRRVSSHSHIINYVDSFTDEVNKCLVYGQDIGQTGSDLTEEKHIDQLSFKNFFLIMEYANSKTLSSYVKNRRSMNESTVKGVFRQITDAVKFLHTNQIAHRDIKLSNLLLQSQGSSSVTSTRRSSFGSFNYTVKLCDFGLSSIVNGAEITFTKPVGTSFYMSPEILRSYFFYNQKKTNPVAITVVPYCAFKGDVWALGVCMFYCLHGYYPLDMLCKGTKSDRMRELEKIFTVPQSISSDKTVDQIYLDRFRNALRNYHYKLSYNGQELLCRMVEVDPNKRAEIVEVAQHAYLR